ncbi:MAG: hypothetical protein JWM98_2994, partial [Thermoleophilia bacterium]|nr:hypothetical protein [Thermoleophilia bacterium]
MAPHVHNHGGAPRAAVTGANGGGDAAGATGNGGATGAGA